MKPFNPIVERVVGLSFLEKLKQPRHISFSQIGKKPLLMATISKNGYVDLYFIKEKEIIEYFKSTYTNLISEDKPILEEIDKIINLNRTYNKYKLYEI